jgi:hypothetical protein
MVIRIFSAVLFIVCPALAADDITISGQIFSATTATPLSNPHISLGDSLVAIGDMQGRFDFKSTAGSYELTITRVGFADSNTRLEITAAGIDQLEFYLRAQIIELDELVIEKQQIKLPTFTDVTLESHIAFKHVYGEGVLKNLLETTGSGACFFDYNNDHFLDLYLPNAHPWEATIATRPSNVLYHNNGEGTFTDISASAGVGDRGFGMGCAAADFDNDGDMDLYLTNFGANVFYRNNGDGTFTDITSAAGVQDERWSVGLAWADIDNDGDLDLYVVNYLDFDPDSPAARSLVSIREGFALYPGPRDFAAQPDALFLNNGDGTFSDVAAQRGINAQLGKGMSCTFGDYDFDGDVDLFVSNDRTANQLYRNDGATFSENALWAGVAYDEAGQPSGAMGVEFADYDNDGLLDLWVTDFIFEYNALYHNEGDGTFEDATRFANLAQPSFGLVAWGSGFLDYDSDGFLDVYVANGHVHENIDMLTDELTFEEPNQLFHNNGDGTFEDVSIRSGSHFTVGLKVSRGVAFADYENDGDVDIFVSNAGDTPNLLRNDGGNREHWLAIHLVGTQSNRNGAGAIVRLKAGPTQLVRHAILGSSYLSQSDQRLFFGLGGYEDKVDLEITWPSGHIDHLHAISSRQFLIVTEGTTQTQHYPAADLN